MGIDLSKDRDLLSRCAKNTMGQVASIEEERNMINVVTTHAYMRYELPNRLS